MRQFMIHYILVLLIVVALWLGISTTASARDWTVTFQLHSAETGDAEIGDELQIPDVGGIGNGSSIPGFTVTHSPATQTLSVRIDAAFQLNDYCTADVLITGTATVTGSSSLLATGNIQSSSTNRCVVEGQVYTSALPLSGTFRAVSAGGDASVVDALITGTIRVTTAGNLSFPLAAGSVQMKPGTTIITGPGDRVVLTFGDGSVVEVEENTRFVIETDDLVAGLNLFLAQGFTRIRAALQGSLGKRFSVRTPTVAIAVRGTEYTIQHQASANSATTTVSVIEGLVDVEERGGDFYQLGSGMTRTMTAVVNRPILLLPVDEYRFTLGSTQWFSWVAQAGAAGYLLEATTDPPGFYDTNPYAVEPGSVILRIPLSETSQADGIVEWGLNVPAGEVPSGQVVWWRIFATDTSGNILSGETASDAALFIVQ